MAKRKPRKRAYIPPASEVTSRRERTSTTRPARSQPGARGGTPRRGMPGWEHPVPTWGRTLRRLPMYLALMIALQMLIPTESNRGLSLTERVIPAALVAIVVTVAFAPLMHAMDRWSYNRWLRTQAGRGGDAGSGRR